MFEISSKMLYLENLDGKKINTQAWPDPLPLPHPWCLTIAPNSDKRYNIQTALIRLTQTDLRRELTSGSFSIYEW